MRVLMLSTSDLAGGAGRAAYRIYQGLQKIGLDSRMLVQQKVGDDFTVQGPQGRLSEINSWLRPRLDHLLWRCYRSRRRVSWNTAWWPSKIHYRVAREDPDVVNLQWICDGFVPVAALGRMRRPLVLTMQDPWAFTGGCHYPSDCQGYQEQCGACPQLGSRRQWDLSRWVWRRKARHWRPLALTVVAISHWLADCARGSSLFREARVEVIPNGLDTERYRPIETRTAREIMGLPQDKQLVLFGAMDALKDERKGGQLLFKALEGLHQAGKSKEMELVVFGASRPPEPPSLGFPTHYYGNLHDDYSLALLYSAADVMVVPSVQEALGQTATEACACGTPVVAFDNSGLRDVVDHQQNGYLARGLNTDDLARGIYWVLADPGRQQALGRAARQKALREFDFTVVARRYLEVFQRVLGENSTSRQERRA